MAYGFLARLALVIALAVVLGGCLATSDRAAVPGTEIGAARVSGYGDIRFWGDEVTPTIEAIIRRQYRQVQQASLAGEPGANTRKADFLAISGGGGDGAYAAGFLTGWTRSGQRPHFEVVTGVSTGALAAPFAFLGPRYDEVLKDIYTRYGDTDLVIDRGIVGLLGSSRYDTAPLKRLIGQYMTDDVLDAIAQEYAKGRRLLVQTTNIDAQRPVIWDLSAIAASRQPDRRDLIVQVLLASSAIPGAFPPVRIQVNADGRSYNELHVDGGVTAQIFFAPPRTRFAHFEQMAFGGTRERTLYVIRNGKLTPDYKPTEEGVFPLAIRSITTLTKYQGLSDLRRLDRIARETNARVLFTSIPPNFTKAARSDFDREYMGELFLVGEQMGLLGRAWRSGPPPAPALAL
ncbi:patatin-like phospholipase family protein (plasmid) [Microvirga terrae]|uniref:Patatin-like phospholipase family protein n=1 Tax=Microvirga terrae TaxID=2740529 RepID=A0ABY5RZR8_9HYPH|nr:patatin-like phospholipase family protein [Microvirga terrae]UVF22741.1 patatin-like phospholipase family protein [Microvirga terrae]